MLKPARHFRADDSRCHIREVFNQRESNLEFLSLSEIDLMNARSPEVAYKSEEALVFNLAGPVTMAIDGTEHRLEHYDVAYVPLDTGFSFEHQGEDPAKLYVYRALGDKRYEPFLSRYADAKQNAERIRHLNKKVVYKMFDVSESANRLLAGYTFYEDHTRAWPPHNHTDQEEVYSFIEGEGAMSVYEDDEHQTFVRSVGIGDHITIPLLNYHPVFSDDKPLCFIWCIAGERYWVGDKNAGFMKGEGTKITT